MLDDKDHKLIEAWLNAVAKCIAQDYPSWIPDNFKTIGEVVWYEDVPFVIKGE